MRLSPWQVAAPVLIEAEAPRLVAQVLASATRRALMKPNTLHVAGLARVV
jgi:hypothetical protein